MPDFEKYAKVTESDLLRLAGCSKSEILTWMTIVQHGYLDKVSGLRFSKLTQEDIAIRSNQRFSTVTKATAALQRKGLIVVIARGWGKPNQYEIPFEPEEPQKTNMDKSTEIVDNSTQIVDNSTQIVDNSTEIVDNSQKIVDNFSKPAIPTLPKTERLELPKTAIPIRNKKEISNYNNSSKGSISDGRVLNENHWKSIHSKWKHNSRTSWTSKAIPNYRMVLRLVTLDKISDSDLVGHHLGEISKWMDHQYRRVLINPSDHVVIWQGNDWTCGLMRWFQGVVQHQNHPSEEALQLQELHRMAQMNKQTTGWN